MGEMREGEHPFPPETLPEATAPTNSPPNPAMRIVLRVVGLILTAVGIAGIVLPLLPGTLFLIIAAACFARSSPRLEQWILTHPKLGPGVIAWRERGAIPLRAKMIALPMMALSAWLVTQSAAPIFVKAGVICLLIGAAAFVATRSNR